LYDANHRRGGLAVADAVASLAGASATASLAAAKTQQAPVLPPTAVPAARAFALGPASPSPAARAPGPSPARATPAPAAAGAIPLGAAVNRQALFAVPAVRTPAASTLTALQRLDWFIRIRVKKFQLKQSFSILIFLGPVPDKVEQWRSSPNLVGNHSEFVNSNPESCPSCLENANAITEGFIDLDSSLERLGYGRKTEEQIEKFIHDQISWRIQKVKLLSSSLSYHGS
jgi:hypothetical protein